MDVRASLLFAWLLVCAPPAFARPPALLLDAKIALGEVRGRMDHLALDVSRQRLYVAELGNDSLGIVDLRARRALTTIHGLSEPQGVGYVPSTDSVWVTNGGDGTLRLFRGEDARPDGIVPIGDDADNIRVDAKANRVYVGYGSGRIAILDALTRRKVDEIPLKAHPESFQLDAATGRLFVNVPQARQIAVIKLASARQVGAWSTQGAAADNFPLALDSEGGRVLVGFRSPATMIAYEMQTGRQWGRVPICGDADDIAWDRERRVAYVSCGDGAIDVVDLKDDQMRQIERVATASGARTLLYSPELDRIFLASRSTKEAPAAVWVYRPGP